jgi:hypothetical protein
MNIAAELLNTFKWSVLLFNVSEISFSFFLFVSTPDHVFPSRVQSAAGVCPGEREHAGGDHGEPDGALLQARHACHLQVLYRSRAYASPAGTVL